MRILIIDNFDSFTFNLFHYCEQFCDDVTVVRNNAIELDEIQAFDKIVLSPGPGLPKDAGITLKTLEHFSETKSILGVCLGMQAMAEFFGGSLKNLPSVLHGKTSLCTVEKPDLLFKDIGNSFEIGHYHSWVIDRMPKNFEVTAKNAEGLIMAMSHKNLDLKAVQFHPESILTQHGLKMIENWVRG
ncbi:anthranilate synthase component II [Halocola ammonii]